MSRTIIKKSIAFLTIFTMMLGVLPLGNMLVPAVQAGTAPAGYIVIRTPADLDNVRNNLSGRYWLANDIDLSVYPFKKNATDSWSAARGWKGIGDSLAKGFSGVFEGNGYTIKGLWSKDRGSNEGLFSWLTGATIRDLNIELDPRGITGSGERKGVLSGNAYKGTLIENVHVVGTGMNGSPVSGSANYIAGFVGVINKSEIRSSSATDIHTTGFSYTAGFLGVAYGASSISDCVATGNAAGSGSYAGGFIGAVYGASYVGYSTAYGSAQTHLSYAGGFAGVVYEGSYVEHCFAFGSVRARLSYAGGFTAALYGAKPSKMFRCIAFGDVQANHYGGGLIGTQYDKSIVEECAAYGNVTVNNYIGGGLIGELNRGTILNAYAQGNVTSLNGTSSTSGYGGLVGYASGTASATTNTIKNTYSSGTVTLHRGPGSLSNTNLYVTESGAYLGRSGVTMHGYNYFDNETTVARDGATTRQNNTLILGAYGSNGNIRSHLPNNLSLPYGYPTVELQYGHRYDIPASMFIDWDFDTIWGVGDEEGNPTYPYFIWMPGKQRVVPVLSKTSENITSTDGKTYVNDMIEYTITALNNGNTAWRNVMIIDELPEGITFVDNSVMVNGAAAQNVTYDDATRALVVNVGDIGVREEKIVTFKATVNPDSYGLTIRNAATVKGDNGEGFVEEPDGRVVENKALRTVTGSVYPVVFNDRGFGEEFLKAFEITVELRTDFWTPATENLTTIVRSDSDVGTFTFEDVGFGEYILYITRPGYLTRTMKVTVSENDPEIVILNPPGGVVFSLLGGDLNGDGIIDVFDLLAIGPHFGAQWGDPNYVTLFDLNGDGIIDQQDLDIVFDSFDSTILGSYPGAYWPTLSRALTLTVATYDMEALKDLFMSLGDEVFNYTFDELMAMPLHDADYVEADADIVMAIESDIDDTDSNAEVDED